MESKKPGLALIIGKALGKKPPSADEESHDYDSPEEADSQLQEIADELVDAVHAKDKVAVKELLQEAFDCMMADHE